MSTSFNKLFKCAALALALVVPVHAAGVDSVFLDLADAVHVDWQKTARAQGRTERYKPVKVDGKPFIASSPAEIDAFCTSSGVPAEYRAKFRIADGGQVEQDILAIPNRYLSSNNRGENDASARAVLKTITEQLDRGGQLDAAFVEVAAKFVHDEWMKRNGSWAPPHQMLPFEQLSKEEADKDRDMVRLGIQIAQRAGL